MQKKFSIVVLISGNGSNLQALIDAQARSDFHLAAVISNNPKAYGLTRATRAHIPTIVLPHQSFDTREAFDRALHAEIEKYRPALIALAGFMRRLGPQIVKQYLGQMINIHPSLLPKYPGLHTHQKVIAAKDKQHGASIHFVTDELDAGPIISQARLTVLPEDTADSLKSRVHLLEHRLYPHTIQCFAERRISLTPEHKVMLDGKILDPTGYNVA